MSKVYSIFMMCLLFMVGSLASSAATVTVELDKEYAMNINNVSDVYVFTPEEDGVLTVTSSGYNVPAPFSDAKCSTQLDYTHMATNTGAASYMIDVTKGTTIYFRWSGMNTVAQTVTFTMGKEKSISLTETSPKAGETLMCTETTQVSLTFNNAVGDVDNVEIVTEGGITEPLAWNTSSNRIFFDVKQTIYEMMVAGKLKEGEKFTVKATGVSLSGDNTIKAGDNGTVEVEYVCGKQPITIDNFSSNFSTSHTFKSFWNKGDEDGIMTLTFTGNINVDPEKVTLTYGDTSDNSEASEKYRENPPITVDGNKLIIDLTDKTRTPVSMLGTNTTYETILLTVSNVCDTDGYPVYTPTSGSNGSYTRTMPYKVESVDASVAIYPESGSDITDGKSIAMLVTDYDKFSFTGAKFIYTDSEGKTQVANISKEQMEITKSEEFDNASAISIPIPAEVAAGKDVYLSFTDLKAADGEDYSSLFSAKYNGFTVMSFTYTPTDDSAPIEIDGLSVETINGDSKVLMVTNYDSKTGSDSLSYVGYYVEDLNAGENDDKILINPTHLDITNKTDEGWNGWIPGLGTYKFILGHTYRVVVSGYQQTGKNWNMSRDKVVGSDTLYIHGLTAPYTYSDIEYEGMTPEDGTISDPNDFNIHVKYSGLVQIVKDATVFPGGGASNNAYFDSITAVDPITDEDGDWSNEWILSVSPENAKSSTFEARYTAFLVAAIDQDGNRVKGNNGVEDNSTQYIDLKLDYNGVEISVTPTDGSTVDTLYQFTVSTPDVIQTGALALKEAYLTDGRRLTVPVVSAEPVYTGEALEMYLYEQNHTTEECQAKYGTYYQDRMKAYSMLLTLQQPVTEEGEYTFIIPGDYFTSGEQFNSDNCKGFTGTYIIEAPAVPEVLNFTTDPANGSTVSSFDEIKSITVTLTDYNEPGVGSGKVIVKKDGEQVATISDPDWGVELNQYVLNIPASANLGDGIYTLEIPEGYFTADNGDALPAFTIEYGVNVATGINAVTVNGSTTKAYNLNGVRVSGKLPAGIYIINGKKTIIK